MTTKGGHHWGDLERCIGQRHNKKATTKTNDAQRGMHLEIEQHLWQYDMTTTLSVLFLVLLDGEYLLTYWKDMITENILVQRDGCFCI